MGIERLLELIEMPQPKREGYYIGAMDDDSIELAIELGHKKRKSDKAVVEYKRKSLKNHLKGADKINARYCVVIGEDERNNGTVWVKDLQEKTEKVIPQKEF